MRLRRSWIAAPAASALLLVGLTGPSRADDADAKAVEIIDKAVKALGGEEKLSKVQAATWNTDGKLIMNGADNPFKTRVTFQGDERMHLDFEGDFDGNSSRARRSSTATRAGGTSTTICRTLTPTRSLARSGPST